MSLYEITNGFDPKCHLTMTGVTDEVTECFCCGKKNLKRTVVLKDEWGQFSFYGTTCAYNALNIWNKPAFVQDCIKSATRAKSNTDTITASEVIETEINGIKYVLWTKKGEPRISHYSPNKDKWYTTESKPHIDSWHFTIQEEFQKKGTLAHVSNINLIAEFLDKYTRHGFPF